ncbi:MAG: hypothetical protein ACOY4W_16820 [Thermodesulfobacteriota bacterium]
MTTTTPAPAKSGLIEIFAIRLSGSRYEYRWLTWKRQATVVRNSKRGKGGPQPPVNINQDKDLSAVIRQVKEE